MIEDLPFFNQPYPTTSFSSGRQQQRDIHAIVRKVWIQVIAIVGLLQNGNVVEIVNHALVSIFCLLVTINLHLCICASCLCLSPP